MVDSQALCMPLTGLVPGLVPAEVVAIVAHDLRTPLNAISMGAALLQDESQGGQFQAEALAIIRRAARRMDRLISDLLDSGRLDAGRTLRIDAAPLQLAAVLDQACDEVRASAKAKGQTLNCEVHPDLPEVYADRDRLAQVVSNLLGNATKFTPPGGRIKVAASSEGHEVRVSVTDSGPGIPGEDLPRVFDAYWQAQKTASLGCGLGLKIARAIVQSHGGRMWAESPPGAGATFSFTVPVPGSAEMRR
jgi:signal transduction histidine kinase